MTADPDPREAGQQPVPTSWRPILSAIVDSLRGRAAAIPSLDVAPLSPSTAAQITAYLGDYGETLAPLPPATWETSICQWSGAHWDVLVDLWTEESGASDLVLQVEVTPREDGYLFTVHMVYVP